MPQNVIYTTVMIPQGNGAYLVKPGQPKVIGDEVRVAEFAKQTGLSVSQIERYCADGTIKSRKLSPRPRSQYLIPRSELQRFLDLE
jgi:excisionase family DNA binding protein